jgi:hypothetical protein
MGETLQKYISIAEMGLFTPVDKRKPTFGEAIPDLQLNSG